MWVDGAPRVSCVTPVRRLDGRSVTTLEGLPPALRTLWADALVETGGSQCGFCTPGIVMRLAALAGPVTDEQVDRALLAHLCRCTGWHSIEAAARTVLGGRPEPHADPSRDLGAAAERAALEGGVPQRVGPGVVLGDAGFADDGCPADALVAVPDGRGGYVTGETPRAARALAGKLQGRSSTKPLRHPVEVPPGEWILTLVTTWVEPAYVEPDVSWCAPGGQPASPYGNGGAFGGKLHSPVGADARRLADEYGRTVRVLWSREDVVRLAPKRPPIAGGVTRGGSGVLRVGVTGAGLAAEWDELVGRVAAVAPGMTLEQVPIAGPAVSSDLRAAVWAEAAVLAVAAGFADAGPGTPVADVPVEVVAPSGGRAVVRCGTDGDLVIEVDAGDILDETVLRSYALGAAHQAVSWVRSEGIAVDATGAVSDLTMRSFGILPAWAMPPVTVTIGGDRSGTPVPASDAVFAAVAAARWLADGLPRSWPTQRGGAVRT